MAEKFQKAIYSRNKREEELNKLQPRIRNVQFFTWTENIRSATKKLWPSVI